MNYPPASFNMAAYVLGRAGEVPDKDALIIAGDPLERWSFATLEARVRAVATGFLNAGLTPGDRILMRLGNTAAFPLTYLAAIAVGLIPVPTSVQLTQVEITRIAQEIDPSLIVADTGISLPDHAAPVLLANDLTTFFDQKPCQYALGDPNRPAYIIYTSGTSGKPRAVVHAHRAMWARRSMIDGWYGLTIDDRVLHAGAFNWSYTLGTGLLDPWSVGATAIVPADGTEAHALGDLLEDHNATIFAASPGIYRRILRQDLPPLPHLRHGLSAGEKIPNQTIVKWVRKTGTPIHEAFGMSECSTFISGSPNRPAPMGALGYVQDGRRVKILNEGRAVSPSGIGSISISTDDPGLMLGYLEPDGAFALPLRDGYFQSGDLATQDEGGAITYHGRTDDMMNAGGFRVSPLEVEAALSDVATLTQLACCDVRVKKDTSVIAAFYTAPNVIDESVFKEVAALRLASYKIPRLFVRVDTLPRGTNNKLLRRQLRLDWEAAHGQT